MRSASVVGLLGLVGLAGCASAQAAPRAPMPVADPGTTAAHTAVAVETQPVATDDPTPVQAQGPWIHAEPDSDVVLARGGDGYIGVWVDVPALAKARVRTPVDLALLIDTSGSMEGAKIQAARASARSLVERLADGDILSVDIFSDAARSLVPPVRLTSETRARILSTIAELGTGGSTNMFEGLEMAERHVAQAPAVAGTQPVRRIVLISDGQANVGPSSPDALGELAQRALSLGAQVTSLGVGLDYDERTLDAIAERTSGRLFHVGDPREMEATLEHEIGLLSSTVADQAVIEVVPAPGVELQAIEGAHMEWGSGRAARIPLGALYAGQHREALVRVRLSGATAGTQRAIASVRLTFQDPQENDVERVQEVLARASTSDDPGAVALHASPQTHAMIATLEAAKTELQAAQDVGAGNYAQAQSQLAAVELNLREEASRTKDAAAKKKLDSAAQTVAAARRHATAAAAAPAPAAARADVLEMNSGAMHQAGY
jgi:Ca-activated chloride channel family protein